MIGAIDEAIKNADFVHNYYSELVQFVGHVYGHTDHSEKNEKIIARILERQAKGTVDPVTMAVTYAGFGKLEEAFAWLEKGYRQRSGLMIYLKVYGRTFLQEMHSDSRYEDLIQKIGFER
jgi:hypothetical protein